MLISVFYFTHLINSIIYFRHGFPTESIWEILWINFECLREVDEQQIIEYQGDQRISFFLKTEICDIKIHDSKTVIYLFAYIHVYILWSS